MHFINRYLSVLITVTAFTATALAENQEPSNQSGSDSLAIASAIQSDLADAERISGSKIDVQHHDGLVTLSGVVDSLLDKQLASKIAKRTRGVQAVANQILVKKSDRPDEEIRDDVLKVLATNGSVDRPQIAVSVTHGEVAMTGKVDSLAEKRIAGLAAAGVRGVTKLDNQLTVALTSDRSDRNLREEIKALIVHSVYLDDVDIKVEVEKHVAKLSGKVHSAAQKDHLKKTAEVWGISVVDMSNVKIDPDIADDTHRTERYANTSDESIQTATLRSYQADPIVFAHANKIDIQSKEGVVTLKGTVSRVSIKDRAERLASDVVGVRRVRNELDVEYPGESPADVELIRHTQAALARSPYLERRDLRVHCQQGHVSLYGVVESQLEKRVAGWLAGGVPGVVHVDNALAVEKKWTEKSDQQIQSDLERKLKYTLFDRSNRIRVNVQNGVAILSGEVDTWRQWQAALDLALEAGARHPHNLIQVRYHPPHSASRVYVPQ